MTAKMGTGTARVLQVRSTAELRSLLAVQVCSPTPLVLRLSTDVVPLPDVAAVLGIWAERSAERCGLALVLPGAEVLMARSVAMDLAMQGALVGIFSERDLPFAVEHAVREIGMAAAQAAWRAARDAPFQLMLSAIIAGAGHAMPTPRAGASSRKGARGRP